MTLLKYQYSIGYCYYQNKMWSLLVGCLLLSVSVVICQPYYSSVLTMNQLAKIADRLELKFNNLHEKYTYADLLSKNDYKLSADDVDSETLMESMAFRISKLFKDKQKALKKIVRTLEESSKDYKWDDELENNFTNVVFMNASTEKEFQNNRGTMDDYFGVRINKTVTGIHVPVEIYEGYPDIVNGLNWSSSVDETFMTNSYSDGTLGWQYFAAQSGFMRLYPAVTKWYIPAPYDSVDLFDARRRPWYIQGSVSPKDVIILIDRSGSVHGQTFTIMRFAVETLIDTLGEDDFVNVAAFNETTNWISEIVYDSMENPMPPEYRSYNESLIQASNVNKKALIGDIKQLTVRGIANYTDALDFAYRSFKKRVRSGEISSDCHKLIMFFSDGGTEWPQEVVDKYKNDTDTMDVRIFTYAVGPHPIPTAVLKQMACETGGEHTVITTSSGVRTKIQDSYLSKIAGDLQVKSSYEYSYTSSFTSAVGYLHTLASHDSSIYDLATFTFQQDHLTQNLTIGITLPVFNMSSALDPDDKRLAGVAGVDIPIQHIENFVPRETLGPIGYSFLVNHNGFLVLHPRLNSQQSYLEDPPHLDFLDLEMNPEKLFNTRRQMVQGDRGGIALKGKLLLDDKHIVENGRLKYTFMPIHDSPFSLGMVTVSAAKHLTVFPNNNMKTPVSIDPVTSILAPWDFCGFHAALTKSDLINKRIIEDFSKCNDLLLTNVLWAQEWTNPLILEWQATADKLMNITSRAIYTRFGLARVVGGRFEVNGSIVFAHPMLGSEWRDPQKNPALKRGMIDDELTIYPHTNGAFLSKPVSVNSVKAAVVGLNVTSEYLDYELFEAISETTSTNSSIIMIIDEAGYIVSSSQYENSSGEFLGERWPLLLEKLVEAGIYGRQNVTDYQAYCPGMPDFYAEYNAACGLDFFLQPMRLLGQIVFQLLTVVQYIQYIFIHGFVCLTTSPPMAEAIHRAGINDACILQHTVYYLTSLREFSGNISCMGDSAQVLVRRIGFMNAVTVAVDESLVNLNCDGWMDKKVQIPNEMSTNSERTRIIYPKELANRIPRDRRKPEQCGSSPRTEREKCSSASSIAVEVLLLWICALFLRL